MGLLILTSVAVALLGVMVYAQYRIGAHTRGAGKVWMTRFFLLVVALGFGAVISAGAPDDRLRILMFLIGLGVVHLPAAIILYIKRRRGSGKT